MNTTLQQFLFSAGDDLGSAGDNGTVFVACTRLQVVEAGVFVSTDLVTGGASADIVDFDITSASQGVTASEDTAPARGSSSATVEGPSTSVTVQDGKVLSLKTDFTMEKGETLTCEVTGDATSGSGQPYILYYCAGQLSKEDGEQRSGEAVE